MGGVSNSGSKEIVNKCQFVNERLAKSFCCTSEKLLDMRGQKFGSGQRVKIKVIAMAWPLNWLVLTAWPSSLVKWYSGSGSPASKGCTSRARRKVPREGSSIGAAEVSF